MTLSPEQVYQARKAAYEAEAESLATQGRRIADARLVVFSVLLALAIAVVGFDRLGWGWLVPGAIAFIALVVWHNRVTRRRQQAHHGIDFYQRGLARLNYSFAGTGFAGEAFANPQHPFAPDLDLFGRGSLFELLCTARTFAGQQTLAHWLTTRPENPQEVRRRQHCAQVMCGRLDFREEVDRLAGEVRETVHPELLLRWVNSPPQLRWPYWPPVLVLLGALVVTGGVVWWLGGGLLLFLVALAPVMLINYALKNPVSHISAAVAQPERELQTLSRVLGRIEQESFEDPELVTLQNALRTDNVPASEAVRRLDRTVQWFESRTNLFFAPVAYLLLWGPLFAHAIERWRTRFGVHIPRWLEAAGEIEALAAIAGYTYEHPDDPVPELTDGARPVFEARALSHPLLSPQEAVPNSVSLGQSPQVMLVSGSNMSGKSTLLRTVGINAVLAYTGAPVRAQALKLAVFSLGATLRIQDSLQSGSSRFYAEITRLKTLFDLADQAPPVLFLLDEILHGTNSHDRVVGAQALVRRLIDRGAVGLVTTHDLALTQVTEQLPDQVENVHFSDELQNGRLHFDYRLRPGVVQKSNAIDLMRAVGLEV